jgi:hypothetical protein
MRRGRWAAIAAAFAIAAVAVVTAGCGGGSGNALSLDPVAAAATKTQHAGPARIRLALVLTSPQLRGGKQVKLDGTGAIDGTSGELNLSVGSHGSMKEVFLEQNGHYVLYLQLGVLSSRIPGGKHWVELDLSKLGQAAGLDLGKLVSGGQLQPGDLLSMLTSEGATIRNLGPATVDGVAATHYSVKIDTAKALEAKGLTSPLIAAIAVTVPTVPEDVWIGKDGLVRRIHVALGLAQSGRQARVGMTMDLYDYGADVAIEAPPSSDVFDATQLAQKRIGSIVP